MSGTTTNLGLFKYNPNTDGDQTFNIDNALNNNWDSLDTLIGALTNLTTTQKASLVGAINELVTNLGGKAAKDLGNLDATGQAIIDAKIEAEALAAQNGYIKFKLNGISNKSIIIQWGKLNGLASYWGHIVTFPIAFTEKVIPLSSIDWAFTTDWYNGTGTAKLNAVTDVVAAPYSVTLTNMGLPSYSNHYWLAIGY